MYSKARQTGRKITGIFLSIATAAAAFTGLGAIGNKPLSLTVNASADYGLMDNCQDGVILHAWEWSFNNIRENMANIAAAGYTSVQTSVIQQAKESTKGKTNENWWVYYQPANFTIDDTGNSALGTKAEFKAMCDEAHKYGIHVIVDVVSNHLGNQTKYNISNAVPSDIKDDSNCWHSEGFTEINYDSRYSITHGSMGGLPDLNTENSKIQNYVINYLKECIDCGADGFRFDAAKHISVPSEGSQYTFWSSVIPAAKSYYAANGTYDSLYCYGEILGSTGGPAISGYTAYMSVTDDSTGKGIRNSISNGNAGGAATSYYDKQAGAENSVLWAESHDTYSNTGKETTNVSESIINKTWAMVGSRNKATALYFARTNGYRGGNIGEIYSTQCFNKEVVEVNKFHNYFNGQSEYLAYSGSIAYNERGTSGVVLVNVSGNSTSVNVKANRIADGTYTDQVSGNEFKVSGGYIKGKIGSTGIAVVYNKPALTGSVSASPASGSSFTDSLTVTLKESGTENARYYTSEGVSGTYTSGQKITIGSSAVTGASITVTLTATNSEGKIITEEYDYYKRDPEQSVCVYFDNSAYKWSKVYAYIYDESVSPTIKNAEWPGSLMTYNSQTKLYEIAVPDNLVNGNVIFTESSSATTNRYPANMEKGMQLSGSSMIFGANHSWKTAGQSSDAFINTSSVSDTKMAYGKNVTVSCGSSGGQGSVKYAVYYKKSAESNWTLKQNYSENTSVTFKPACAAVYDVCVKAKDGENTVAKKYMQVIVTANTNSDLSNTSSLSAKSVPLGEKVTVSCSSTGLSDETKYAVFYKQATDAAWKTVQSYSTKTSVEFKPLTATVYNVCIKAKDNTTGTVSKVYLNLTVTASSNSTLSNTSSLSSTKVEKGGSITVTCAGTGGSGTKQYAVFCKKSTDSTYTTKQGYKTNSTVKLTFTEKGTYNICVKVKDSTGAVAKKYFTINCT